MCITQPLHTMLMNDRTGESEWRERNPPLNARKTKTTQPKKEQNKNTNYKFPLNKNFFKLQNNQTVHGVRVYAKLVLESLRLACAFCRCRSHLQAQRLPAHIDFSHRNTLMSGRHFSECGEMNEYTKRKRKRIKSEMEFVLSVVKNFHSLLIFAIFKAPKRSA